MKALYRYEVQVNGVTAEGVPDGGYYDREAAVRQAGAIKRLMKRGRRTDGKVTIVSRRIQ